MGLVPWIRTSLPVMVIGYVFTFCPQATSFQPYTLRTTSKINLIIISSSTTTLHATRWIPIPSLNPFSRLKNNYGLDSGIVEETALLLTNKKRQDDFKNEMRQKFPLIPPTLIANCLDSLADSFSNVAPSQLKKALKPGGLEEVRPGLEASLFESLRERPFLGSLPPTTLAYLVSLALDYVLMDVEELLADPYRKLWALEERRRRIERYMTRRQLLWYRIRYRPIRTAVVVATVVVTSVALVRWYRHLAIASIRFQKVSRIILDKSAIFVSVLLALYSTIASFIQVAVAKVFVMIGTASEAVKKNA